jgi:hypothetical protein
MQASLDSVPVTARHLVYEAYGTCYLKFQQ